MGIIDYRSTNLLNLTSQDLFHDCLWVGLLSGYVSAMSEVETPFIIPQRYNEHTYVMNSKYVTGHCCVASRSLQLPYTRTSLADT
jgi:hypothetical protein